LRIIAVPVQMSPSLIPVLVNALSEQGAFQDSGQAVPTAGGTIQRKSLEKLLAASQCCSICPHVCCRSHICSHCFDTCRCVCA
jgi:hypothetical protein